MFRITLRLMGCGISATTLGAFGKHFVPKAHHLKYLEGFVADMRKHK